MQLIYNAANLTDAHILAGLLESHGIVAYVSGHYLQGGVGDLAPTDLARVYVEEKDVEAAMEHVVEYQAREEPSKTPPPPNNAPDSNKVLLLALSFMAIVIVSYLIAWR